MQTFKNLKEIKNRGEYIKVEENICFKLLEEINMLKYCENALDRKIRLAREDEARKVTDSVIRGVTDSVTKKLTEEFACNLLKSNSDLNFVHKMTGLSIKRIKELKFNL